MSPLGVDTSRKLGQTELTPTDAPWKRAKPTRFRLGQFRLACPPSNVIRAQAKLACLIQLSMNP